MLQESASLIHVSTEAARKRTGKQLRVRMPRGLFRYTVRDNRRHVRRGQNDVILRLHSNFTTFLFFNEVNKDNSMSKQRFFIKVNKHSFMSKQTHLIK